METPDDIEKRLARSAVLLAQSHQAVQASRQALDRARALLERPVVPAQDRAA